MFYILMLHVLPQLWCEMFLRRSTFHYLTFGSWNGRDVRLEEMIRPYWSDDHVGNYLQPEKVTTIKHFPIINFKNYKHTKSSPFILSGFLDPG